MNSQKSYDIVTYKKGDVCQAVLVVSKDRVLEGLKVLAEVQINDFKSIGSARYWARQAAKTKIEAHNKSASEANLENSLIFI